MEDPQIAEFKELVRQNIAISQETNKMVHKMRSAAKWKSFFWLVLVLISLGISVYGYYYFVAPRIEQIKNIYQTNIAPLQGAGNSINNFLKQFGQGTTTSPR